jgi:hypothetical protein
MLVKDYYSTNNEYQQTFNYAHFKNILTEIWDKHFFAALIYKKKRFDN